MATMKRPSGQIGALSLQPGAAVANSMRRRKPKVSKQRGTKESTEQDKKKDNELTDNISRDSENKDQSWKKITEKQQTESNDGDTESSELKSAKTNGKHDSCSSKIEKEPHKTNESRKNHQSKPAAMTMTTMRAGLQRAYLDGLEFLRNKISQTESDVTQNRLSFYGCNEVDEEGFLQYLKQCNDNFLMANNELRRRNIKLEVIDSEMRIVALLNQLRDVAEGDKGEIAFITTFWENIKGTVESFHALVNKFQTNVLNRLNQNCTSYNSADISLEVSNRYTEEISGYISELERELTNMRLLMKTYDGGIHQDLFNQNSKFAEKILVSCDLKAFPILRLAPDLAEKMEKVCVIARKWLDRDEQYMYEVNNYIKETRNIAKKREEDLKNQKEKQKKIEKAVKTANILLQNNKEKLQKIETELNMLEGQLNGFKQEKKCKYEEKAQKSSMADFLSITLTQTRKNYNLQMKRQRLVKQVRELEEFLIGLERELSNVEDELMVKSQQRILITEKVETSVKTYDTLKTDFEKYSDNLEKLEQEVNILSGQLLQLEIIQTYKTSPENVEQIFDRPQTVKLAPSLKEKIKRKRKGLPTEL